MQSITEVYAAGFWNLPGAAVLECDPVSFPKDSVIELIRRQPPLKSPLFQEGTIHVHLRSSPTIFSVSPQLMLGFSLILGKRLLLVHPPDAG
jgi:hypothetical protein